MKIGDKFILVNKAPYHFFTGHNTKNIPQFIEVEVIEQKENVPGEFTNKKEGNTGFIAKGSDGYFYGYNYPRYNEGFGNTIWTRHCSDDAFDKLSEEEKDKMVKDYLWTDVTLFQCPALPAFANNFSIKILFCEKHQNLYYENTKCFYCEHIPNAKKEVTLNINEHKWLGWYD